MSTRSRADVELLPSEQKRRQEYRERWVIHVDMDAFFASCEQLTRPTLKGKPVLVGGPEDSGRGVVAGASYEARSYGARSAMPMYQAARLCQGKAVVVRPRFSVYSLLSAQVFAIFHEYCAVVEQISVDEAFLAPRDLYGRSETFARQWARAVQKDIQERTGLVCSFGVARTKLDAKMASVKAKPHGVFSVSWDSREEVYYSDPVGSLWGIGNVTQSRLHEVGVRTIGDLVKKDSEDIRRLLGAVGVQIQSYASGEDYREVAPRARAKQHSAERTVTEDIKTTQDLIPLLRKCVGWAYRRLTKDGRAARTVTVKIKTSDFRIHTRSYTLPAATDSLELIEQVALALVIRPEESGAVRLVGVGISGLEETIQDTLFPELMVPKEGIHRAEGYDYRALAQESHEERERREEEKRLQEHQWLSTQDVYHEDYGHGWVQGSGQGVVTIRFETRSTGRGVSRTFLSSDPKIQPADPLGSVE